MTRNNSVDVKKGLDEASQAGRQQTGRDGRGGLECGVGRARRGGSCRGAFVDSAEEPDHSDKLRILQQSRVLNAAPSRSCQGLDTCETLPLIDDEMKPASQIPMARFLSTTIEFIVSGCAAQTRTTIGTPYYTVQDSEAVCTVCVPEESRLRRSYCTRPLGLSPAEIMDFDVLACLRSRIQECDPAIHPRINGSRRDTQPANLRDTRKYTLNSCLSLLHSWERSSSRTVTALLSRDLRSILPTMTATEPLFRPRTSLTVHKSIWPRLRKPEPNYSCLTVFKAHCPLQCTDPWNSLNVSRAMQRLL
ncbi:hypothetical protein BDV06DRAFT_161803 [Aspergillus oleicola]